MWKITDTTKRTFNSEFEHIAFTNSAEIVKALTEAGKHKIEKIDNLDSVKYEVASTSVFYEEDVPSLHGKYLKYKLAVYTNDYNYANSLIRAGYTMRTINSITDLIPRRELL